MNLIHSLWVTICAPCDQPARARPPYSWRARCRLLAHTRRGNGATKIGETDYAALVLAWINATFPHAGHRLSNGAVPATPSRWLCRPAGPSRTPTISAHGLLCAGVSNSAPLFMSCLQLLCAVCFMARSGRGRPHRDGGKQQRRAAQSIMCGCRGAAVIVQWQ